MGIFYLFNLIHMNKSIQARCLLLLCLCLIVHVTKLYAQTDTLKSRTKHAVKFEFLLLGLEGNLAKKGSLGDERLLSERPNFAYTSALRVSHLFSDKFGWYAGLRMDYIDEKKSTYYNATVEKKIGEFMGKLLFGGSLPSAMVDLGAIYRIEKNRWDIHPRIGLGFGYFIQDLDSDTKIILTNGTTNHSIYNQRSGSMALNMGLSAHYFFTKKSFLTLNADLRQPLNKSYASNTSYMDDKLIGERKESSISLGRDFNLAVGYGFMLGKRKQ